MSLIDFEAVADFWFKDLPEPEFPYGLSEIDLELQDNTTGNNGEDKE